MTRISLITVIICTYNRCSLLQDTLLSFKSIRQNSNVEIVVVDNNSSDDTERIVNECKGILELNEKLRVSYILEERQGLSFARNKGISYSKGEIVVFLDDDAIPSKNWLLVIEGNFTQNKEIISLGGPVEPKFEIQKPEWLSKNLEMLYSIMNLGTERKLFPKGLHPLGANMAFRRDILADDSFPTHLGRMGNSLISGEESWLFSNISELGQIWYEPEMGVTHFISKDRLNKQWILKRYYNEGLSKALATEGIGSKFRLFIITLAKFIYTVTLSEIEKLNKSQSLLNKCRLESQQGVFRVLFKKSY